MPFTPFHFGLGALAKAIAPKKFSFAGFALAQVMMDLEPAYKMLTGSASDLHIITHNLTGASVIATVTFVVWRCWERIRPMRYAQTYISSAVLAGSCAFGTFSHVFLDGMYHVDMGLPQAHWVIAQARVGGLSGTEALCLGFAVAGAVIQALRLYRSRAIVHQG
jgi:hypothetical protein